MDKKGWVISGKPDGELPIIGAVYEIRDSRKGTFTGRIISISGNFADVEVIEGKIHWASTENKIFDSNPDVVSIRDSLVYLIEITQANIASSGR